MNKQDLKEALNNPSVIKKLKELGYDPNNIKSKKSLIAIIKSDKRFDVLQMSIVSKKYKRGPGGGNGENPHISKFDLILKRLDTMDNRFDKIEHRLDTVDTFIEQQTKFNTKVDLFIDEQRKFNAEQRKFNAKQEKFNKYIDNKLTSVIVKNNLKV